MENTLLYSKNMSVFCNLFFPARDYICESAFIHREHNMKDQKILNRLKKGDASALDALIEKYMPYVSTIVWNIMREKMSVQDAEEVVSDVFVAAWKQAKEIDADSLKGWIAAVSRNKARNMLRRSGKTIPFEEEYLYLKDTFSFENEIEKRLAIKNAVNQLQKKERETLIRHYYFYQPVKDIAHDMRLNESTVKSHLRRGRIHLKKYLEEEKEANEKEDY
ncbi:MAG: sigma-70 family RNA polymerase sigma factor [Clostridia bacterium]|nr:sigma-70 family RNA polymerase sigma factor [Clostridia bacterium]